jgi:hypothetical protein
MANLLHTLPPELREAIFKPVLVDWNGQTPDLIKALRPDRKLYNEALALFYRHNIFTFHKGNGWSFGDMAKEAVLSLDTIRICTGSLLRPEIMSTGLWEVGGSKSRLSHSDVTDKPQPSLSYAENIRVVIIEYQGDGGTRNLRSVPSVHLFWKFVIFIKLFPGSVSKFEEGGADSPQAIFGRWNLICAVVQLLGSDLWRRNWVGQRATGSARQAVNGISIAFRRGRPDYGGPNGSTTIARGVVLGGRRRIIFEATEANSLCWSIGCNITYNPKFPEEQFTLAYSLPNFRVPAICKEGGMIMQIPSSLTGFMYYQLLIQSQPSTLRPHHHVPYSPRFP